LLPVFVLLVHLVSARLKFEFLSGGPCLAILSAGKVSLYIVLLFVGIVLMTPVGSKYAIKSSTNLLQATNFSK